MPRRTVPLKVYRVTRSPYRYDLGHRQITALVATTSQKKAAELMDVTVGTLRNYGGETRNPQDCEVALAEPGTVFWRGLDDRTAYQKGTA